MLLWPSEISRDFYQAAWSLNLRHMLRYVEALLSLLSSSLTDMAVAVSTFYLGLYTVDRRNNLNNSLKVYLSSVI